MSDAAYLWDEGRSRCPLLLLFMEGAMPHRTFPLLFSAAALCVAMTGAPAVAQTAPALQQAPTAASMPATPAKSQVANPLMVSGVIIDKTAENAVIAREEAMADARRAAFRKLAQAHMPAQAAADLPLPDDATLGALVQDLEIKRERLSATRYVGDFTVRFSEAVRRFIPVASRDTSGDYFPEAVQQQTDGAQQVVAAGHVRLTAPVVILPYLQNIAGQMILWGEPNPWRDVWQNQPPRAQAVLPASEVAKAEGKVIVPLGDISDISAGPDTALWSGQYAALDKLRENYGVHTVIVAVANRSGGEVRVDLYDYAGDSLVRRGRIQPVIDPGLDERAAFAVAARDTLREILTAPMGGSAAGVPSAVTLESISRDLTGGAQAAPVIGDTTVVPSPYAAPVPAGVSARGMQVQAGMRFGDFMTWMETQKRLADIVPPVRVNIQTISRDQARFTIGFDGDMNVLNALLAERGMRLTQTGGSDYQLTLVQ